MLLLPHERLQHNSRWFCCGDGPAGDATGGMDSHSSGVGGPNPGATSVGGTSVNDAKGGGVSDPDQAAQDADQGRYGGTLSPDQAAARDTAERAGVFGGTSQTGFHDPGMAASAQHGLASVGLGSAANPDSKFGQGFANVMSAVMAAVNPVANMISSVTEGKSIAGGIIGALSGNPLGALGATIAGTTSLMGGEKSEKASPGAFGMGGYDSVSSALGASVGMGANASGKAGVQDVTGSNNGATSEGGTGSSDVAPIASPNFTTNTPAATPSQSPGTPAPSTGTGNNNQSLGSPLVPIATPNSMALNPDIYSNTFNEQNPGNQVRPFLDPFGRTGYQQIV